MLVRTSVTVKAVVTEEWRRRVAAESQETLRRLEAELAQINFQLRRVEAEREKSASADLAALAEKLEQDAGRRQELRSQLLERLKVIARLRPGELVVQGNAEGWVEVKVGDSWDQVMNCEVVVKDGVIAAIRPDGEEPCA